MCNAEGPPKHSLPALRKSQDSEAETGTKPATLTTPTVCTEAHDAKSAKERQLNYHRTAHTFPDYGSVKGAVNMSLRSVLNHLNSFAAKAVNTLNSTSSPAESPPLSRSDASRETPPAKRQKTTQYTQAVLRGPNEEIEDFPPHSPIRTQGRADSLSISASPVISVFQLADSFQMHEPRNRGDRPDRRRRERSLGSIRSQSSAEDNLNVLNQSYIDPGSQRMARLGSVKGDAADSEILKGMRDHKANKGKKRSSHDAHETDELAFGHTPNKGKTRQGSSSVSHRGDITPTLFSTKPVSGFVKGHRRAEPRPVRVIAAACFDKYLYVATDGNSCYLYPMNPNKGTAELCAITQDGEPHPEKDWLKIASKAHTLFHNPKSPYIKIHQSKDASRNIGHLLIIKLETPADASSVVEWTRDNLRTTLIQDEEHQKLHSTWDTVSAAVNRQRSSPKKPIGTGSTSKPPANGSAHSLSTGISPSKVSPSPKPRTTLRDAMQVSATTTPKPTVTYGRRSLRSTRGAPTADPIELDMSLSPEVPPAPRWSEKNKNWLGDWKTPLQYGRIQLTKDDIPRLDEGQYLNDSIIEFGLKYLFGEYLRKHPDLNKRVYMHNSFFYTSLTGDGSGFKYDSVKRWTAKVDLLSYDYVVVPINQNFHWWVAIICNPGKLDPDARQKPKDLAASADVEMTDAPPLGKSDIVDLATDDKNLGFGTPLQTQSKQRKATYNLDDPRIILLDSLGSPHGLTVKHLRDYLVAEFQDKRGRILNPPDLPPRLGMKAVNLPQQPNFTDCGVYLLGYMQEFVKNPDMFVKALLSKERQEWTLSAPELRKAWRVTILAKKKRPQSGQQENAGKNNCGHSDREISLPTKSAKPSISPSPGSPQAMEEAKKPAGEATRFVPEATKSVEIATEPMQEAAGHVVEPTEPEEGAATNDKDNYMDIVDSIEDSPTPDPPQLTELPPPFGSGMSLVLHSNGAPKPRDHFIRKPTTSPARQSSQVEDEVMLIPSPGITDAEPQLARSLKKTQLDDPNMFTAKLSSSPAAVKAGGDTPIQEVDAASFYKKSTTPPQPAIKTKLHQPKRQVATSTSLSSPARAPHSRRPDASSPPAWASHSERPTAISPPFRASSSRRSRVTSSPTSRQRPAATLTATRQPAAYTTSSFLPTRAATVAENLEAVKHIEPISIDDSD
ncbi:hypothetical protein B0T21DRAFT_409899 [Apiosordaria backusii]|uniref:Ubiquitin-like protease family profile domain-containing protein n=1 Tax=Apiosordaria backusii TaxID=314023 RepID=A0AA40BSE7_9PEZI|nr:hypothetical protein B0T21DRAFT_409899 [Apiosordaria backusii]